MVEKSLDWDVFVHRGLALCKSVFFFFRRNYTVFVGGRIGGSSVNISVAEKKVEAS